MLLLIWDKCITLDNEQKRLAFDFLACAFVLGLAGYLSYVSSASYFVGDILMEKKKYKESIKYFMGAAKLGNIPQVWHNLGWICELGAFDNVEKTKRLQLL